MNLSALSNILLILVVIGVVAVRQMAWRPVLGARDWSFPVIAAVLGAVLLLQSLDGNSLGIIDVVAFVVEPVISLGVGAAMGAIAHIRRIARAAGAPVPAGRTAKDVARAAAEFETRTGPTGLVLWIVLIAVRVGLTFAFQGLGSHLGISTGLILLVLAANRAARMLVIHTRVDRLRRVRAQSGSARMMVS